MQLQFPIVTCAREAILSPNAISKLPGICGTHADFWVLFWEIYRKLPDLHLIHLTFLNLDAL